MTSKNETEWMPRSSSGTFAKGDLAFLTTYAGLPTARVHPVIGQDGQPTLTGAAKGNGYRMFGAAATIADGVARVLQVTANKVRVVRVSQDEAEAFLAAWVAQHQPAAVEAPAEAPVEEAQAPEAVVEALAEHRGTVLSTPRILDFLKEVRGMNDVRRDVMQLDEPNSGAVSATYFKGGLSRVSVRLEMSCDGDWELSSGTECLQVESMQELAEVLPGLLRQSTVQETLLVLAGRLGHYGAVRMLPATEGMEALLRVRDDRMLTVGASYTGQRFWCRAQGQDARTFTTTEALLASVGEEAHTLLAA